MGIGPITIIPPRLTDPSENTLAITIKITPREIRLTPSRRSLKTNCEELLAIFHILLSGVVGKE